MHFLLLIVSLSCLLMFSAGSVSRMHVKHSENHNGAGALKLHEEDQLQQRWNFFKSEHGKTYADAADEVRRKKIFAENLKLIDHQNELYKTGQSTFTAGVNQFTDLTDSEFEKLTACGNFSVTDVPYPTKEDFHLPGDLGISRLPKLVDWRSSGAVTPVKNQGPCGSCWAFSSTGALEAQQFLKKREYVRLSEQNLVDCSIRNGGCYGGWMHRAFADIRDQGGIDTEESYQYEAKRGTCRYTPKSRGATASGYQTLPYGDEEILKRAVAYVGPISVALSVGGYMLRHYKGGIYRDDSYCASRYSINHAVLAVGYNTNSPGNDYWIIKNSWGASWGMDGYILWPRNKYNYCGLGIYGVFPIV